MTPNDSHLQALTAWANAQAALITGERVPATPLQAVSGDASFRRYFRLVTPVQSFIVVDAPPANENSRLFVATAALLRAAPVSAPQVFAVDYTQGFMLLEDFGDTLYLAPLLEAQARGDKALPQRLYTEAIAALVTLQGGVDGHQLPPYDRDRLHTEMALFDTWFCRALLDLQLDSKEQAMIAAAYAFLEDAALAQPQVAVHRDYHSRNLLVLDDRHFAAGASPGIIDFQDAVRGAYTYDLVSLLRDCYIRWDDAQVREWAMLYLARAMSAQVVPTLTESQFRRDFDLMGLQRHLKVMGIFSRLCIRDHKPRYLADIPLVIRYFLDVSAHYPELDSFRNWFVQTVLPVVRTRLDHPLQ